MKGNTAIGKFGRAAALLCTASLLPGGWIAPALAQEAAQDAGAEAQQQATVSNEIVVLARKRAESILKVPVVAYPVSTIYAKGMPPFEMATT